MTRPIGNLLRTYPVTIWLSVGLFSYAWKASLDSTVYQSSYAQWAEQRAKELADLKLGKSVWRHSLTEKGVSSLII